MSKIEWCDETWNVAVGCSRVSTGCERCYAERVAHRGLSESHRGLTVMGKTGPRWTGEVRFLPDRLAVPLGWKKPRRVFVNSMSDLFHPALTHEQRAAVFGVVAACPQHTFQVLTKRDPRPFFAWVMDGTGPMTSPTDVVLDAASDVTAISRVRRTTYPWPLPNLELLVSVEDQKSADERIPWLFGCDAAIRGVSYEPALDPVDFSRWLSLGSPCSAGSPCATCEGGGEACDRLDVIIVGGESGPGARPFDVHIARETIAQCRAAEVACFIKQMGAHPVDVVADESGGFGFTVAALDLADAKGGDMSEWPEGLDVREWPTP